ncbi:MAG: hypothetical protein UR28_C0033G0015 [Candidatus Peregrinibacteria bacterium GW2011_GWF2_33_10]|nr:MAG: hypothetical protein UR28_C0033G0015 [Candidatus Peregrinibacteria bacterium GW2011_GWF2_33_10]
MNDLELKINGKIYDIAIIGSGMAAAPLFMPPDLDLALLFLVIYQEALLLRLIW